jgi:exonuclease VII large subunit
LQFTTVSQRREHDIIALYRGGREDESMFVFSDPVVLNAVVQPSVPVVTAIGHEKDIPPVQQVADEGFASPTKFAEFVRQRNDSTLALARRYLNSINNLVAILEDRKKYRKNITVVILVSVGLIVVIIAYFLGFLPSVLG